MADHFLRIGGVFLVAATLAGCGGDNNQAAAPPPAPPVVVAPPPQENAFGANFGTAFRASPNAAAPATPADGDIVPLSLTTDPVNVG